jgi:WD40 repeat protein
VISSAEPVVRVYDAATGRLVCELKGHEGAVLDLLWCADGKRIVTAGRDDTVRIFDAGSGTSLQVFRNPPDRMSVWPDARRLAWRKEDRLLLILSDQRLLTLDIQSGQWSASPVRTGFLPVQLAAARGASVLAVGANDAAVTVNLTKERRFWSVGQMHGSMQQLAWLPDGDRLLSWAGTTAQGYSVVANRKLGTLIAGIEGEQWLMVGPDGHYRGSEGIEKHIVYVALHEDGSMKTYAPAEFQDKFGWKNDPNRATFLKPAK